ncbi:MAG: DUF21 domain-containing protein [Candidatus Coatesbacteria bacterium]|nr:DUF21 domain-containing protein [Candidatus Coatesbacteria bacterium]
MLIIEISVIAVLLFFSAFFSSSETAYFSLSSGRRETMESSSRAGERRAAGLIARPTDLLVTLLMGNLLVNVASSSLATAVLLRYMETGALEYATLGMTFVLLILGEVTPKSLAAYHPVRWAVRAGRLLNFFRVLFTPVRVPLTRLSRRLMRKLAERSADSDSLTVEELRTALEMAREHGEVDEFESMMLGQIFALEDKRVRQIMTPASDIVSLELGEKPAAALEIFRRHQFARLPVYQDEPDNWVGVVRAQDVGHAVLSGPPANLRPLLRPIIFIPESASALTLLRRLRAEGSHLALVTDEYGVLVGLVTLQDIYDELYEIGAQRGSKLRRLGPERWVCAGSLGLDDFGRGTGVGIVDEYYSSLGGHLTGILGRIPEAGERLSADGLDYEILAAEPTRIVRVLVQKRPQTGGSA